MLPILFFLFLFCLAIGVPIAFSMGVGVVASFVYGMPRGMMNIPTKVFAGLGRQSHIFSSRKARRWCQRLVTTLPTPCHCGGSFSILQPLHPFTIFLRRSL